MRTTRLVALALMLVPLAACARMGPTQTAGQASPALTPQVATAKAAAAIDVSAFIAPKAAAQMTEKDKAEASSAQFFALQFGRPAAPRMWQGDTGDSGKITVGPYVRVNQLDCRDFTHSVTTPKGTYDRSGLACRGTDGTWSVVQSKTAG